jgi:hypothetical protein
VDSIDPNASFGEIAPVLNNLHMRHQILLLPWVTKYLGFKAFHLYEASRGDTIHQLACYLAHELDPQPVPTTPLNDKDMTGHWGWSEPSPYTGNQVKGNMAFVLGAGRSGTSLFRSMLACHKEIYAPDELHLVNFEDMALRRDDLQRLSQQWMDIGLIETLCTVFGVSEYEAILELKRFSDQAFPTAEVYQRIHSHLTGQWLVDKTPVYANHPVWLQRTEQMFDQPKFIFMTRHPYAVMDSFMSKRFYGYSADIWGTSTTNAWHQAEIFWTVLNRNVLEFLDRIPPSRWMRVTYEELMQDSTRVLTNVCQFLSIPFEEAMLDPYLQDEPIACNLQDRSSVDHTLGEAWRKKRPPHELGELTREISKQLGYTLT